MSVTLNEVALRFLLEDEAGPVGIDLRRRSENILRLVRTNATNIIDTLPDEIIQYEISNGDLGLQSVISVEPGVSDRWTSYLADKEQREHVVFAPALDQGLDQ